jgi:hypothetical protein
VYLVPENSDFGPGTLQFPFLAFKGRTLFRQLALEVAQLHMETLGGFPEFRLLLRKGPILLL